jgi:N-acetyl-alpha-D-muramate 1-phosphate uridylyltransferase
VRAVQAFPTIQAVILAAGRGERMRPLTDTTPKPLLQVGAKALLQWQVDALARGGFAELLINTAWLGDQIPLYFGIDPTSDSGKPLSIAYSHEGRDFGQALETAGGLVRLLPLLGDIFWVLAGDVFAPDFEFTMQAVQRFARSNKLAHLWLVPNPEHNPAGDFGLAPDRDAPGRQLALNRATTQYTYSTIGLYRREMFTQPWCDIPSGNPLGIKTPLAPLLRRAIDNQQVSAELYSGPWTDVGTPQRLALLNAQFKLSRS